MELEYRIRGSDYREFSNQYQGQVIPEAKRISDLKRFGVFLLGSLLTFILFAVWWVLGLLALFVFLGFYQFRLGSHLIFTQRLIINPGQVALDSEKSRKNFEWDQIEILGETENLFVLVTEFKRGLMVPKRAFKNEAQMEEFRQLCQENIPNSS